MMSQIHCKQSVRIEKSGWFKHYFPGILVTGIVTNIILVTGILFCILYLHYFGN